MNPNSNILQELQELNSSLSAVAAQTPYTVPNGYFEGLLEQVMRRIKALEAANAGEELAHLSPLLSRVSKQMPYTVPAGYFESVEGRIAAISINIINNDEEISPLLTNLSKTSPYTVPAGYFESVEARIATVINSELSAKEELESISPLLSGLKKTNPYSIPDGYFEALSAPVKEEKSAAKVVSFGSRKWFRLAAAAVVTGVIILAGVMVVNQQQQTKDPIAKVQKEIKKTSDKELTDFLEFTDEVSSESIAVNADDAKNILRDIPESELKAFLEETSEGDSDVENSKLN